MDITVVTWNINFSNRTVGEFEAFSFKNRANFIVSNIKSFQNKSPYTIFALQEVMPDYLDTLNLVFPNDKYEVYTKKVHDVGRMLYTAVPKTLKSERRDIPPIGNNFRDCWDFIDIHEKSGRSVATVVNLHAPMDAAFRLPICKYVSEVCEVSSGNGWPFIIVGDLNTFSDGQGLEQIKLMEESGFKDVTSVILRGSVTSDTFEPVTPRVRVLETFDAYPYDKVPRDDPNFFPFNLDHVLIRNIKDYETVLCYDQERDIIFNCKAYGNSDHFALSFTFKIERMISDVDEDNLTKQVDWVSKLVDSRGPAIEAAKGSYWGMNAMK
jgi:hypothetical protein